MSAVQKIEVDDKDQAVGRLVALGGKEWRSADKHRVYFKPEQANAFAGIERLANVGKYRFAGETISTYRFKEISLDGFYYDVDTGFFHGGGKWADDTRQAAAAELRRLMAEEPDTATAEKVAVVEQARSLDEEKAALDVELAQLQRDAEALRGGEADPAYPAMAARYEEINARLEAINTERFTAARKLK